ncbi:exonuclease domain-containing protein [Rosistilla oblonga]|uniref:exonuclease domain-containing protein n=1 Tax=Rosistilla oblonga TaxID=2527990 RepID=UPI003A9714AD
MDFTSIDVETANPDLSSICQIGVVQFRDGAIVHRWKSFVNPNDYFDPMNVSVHGINKSDVSDAPTFPQLASELNAYLTSSIVCHHTPFDRTALHAVYKLHGIPVPEVQWLDTARVVRRTWLDRSRSGYGLRPVANMLGISFNHHDAEEDARVAGEILLHAIAKSELSATEWLTRAYQTITSAGSNTSERHTRDGNPDGPLYGETAVFTGALSMSRRVAADMAAAAGCDVGSNVTKSTTLLVVGDQDVAQLAGQTKSSKHRKAEANIKDGQAIRILRETDFVQLLENAAAAT